MESGELEGRVRFAFRRGTYRLTLHAEGERDADAIYLSEVVEAFTSEQLELLEDYADDPRGASALFLGFTRVGLPLHAVIAVWPADILVVVTVYRPDPRLWDEWRKRITS